MNRVAWAWGRAELRRSWRGAVVVGLLVAVVGGVVIAAVAGARRTDTAVDRFTEASHAPDAVVGGEPKVLATVAGLPQVARRVMVTFVSLDVTHPPGQFPADTQSVVLDPGQGRRLLEGAIVVSGRIPRREAANEVAVDESVARDRGLSIGDKLTLRPVSFGTRQPTGPELTVTLAGVVRRPQDLDSDRVGVEQQAFTPAGDLYLTPGFLAEASDGLEYVGFLSVSLAHGKADLDAFTTDVLQSSGGQVDIDTDLRDLTEGQDNARRAAHVVAVALLTAGAALGFTAVILLGQWLRREALIDDRRPLLRALGLSGRDMFTAAVLRASLVSVTGALGAIAFAVAVSPMFPISTARRAEIHPGVALNAAVVGLGAVLIFVTVMALHLLALAGLKSGPVFAGATTTSIRTRRPLKARWWTATGTLVAPTTGVRMAFEPGRGVTAVPVRSGLVIAVAAIVAVTTASTFALSLDRFVRSPRSQGWNWDAALAVDDPTFEQPYAVLERHPEVAFAAAGILASFPGGTAGPSLSVLALSPIRGAVGPTLTHGRPPEQPDEVALGADTLADLGIAVGDTVVLTASGTPLRVVGRAVLPAGFGFPNLSFGQGAVVTRAGLERLGEPTEIIPLLLVGFQEGVDVETALELLRRELEGGSALTAPLPADVENLRLVRWIPFELAAGLAIVGGATISHVLLSTIARRQRDFAILRTLGFSSRQTVTTVVCQAAALVLAALTVGIPLGVLAGRWTWAVTVEGIGASAHAVTPALWLAVSVLIALILTGVLAARPAWRAAHQRPADTLRSG